jgi:DNA-binding NarL/FixJ family response regulator
VRQRQVLRRIGEGMTYQEIADDLDISVNTVKAHAGLLKARLGYGDNIPTRAACILFLRTASD